ncbi:MAG TPA: sulfatase-like hydrolase/transferase [Burkholderiaceae bacterium]|nr:sulfatase-like hydrolase/transferase [Burkholderiaceae bacterium]
MPNILLITSDQQRADCFGFENPHISTPHLDALAARGTRFSACITPNLVCQPSRASILTGLLPLTHGVWDNGVDLDPAVGERGFAGSLAGAGWDTAFIGKAHFSTKTTFQPTGTPESRYSAAMYEAGWMGPYMGFSHAELMVLGHFFKNRPLMEPAVGHFERWFLSQGAERGEAQRRWSEELTEGTGAAQTWDSGLPPAWHWNTWVADRSADWLRHHDRSKPFCLWASFADPHHPFDAPAPWSRMYDPDAMPLAAHRTPDLERRPWWHRASLETPPALEDPAMRNFRAHGSRMPAQTDEQLREMTANYYGMISMVDDGVGRILGALRDSGLQDDTLVIFTTDHGELLGHHGLYLKGPTPYEDLLRVGMVMAGPGVRSGGVVAEPVSTLDLAPTFREFAGLPTDPAMQGTSLSPLAAGKDAPRTAAWSEWTVHPSRCGVALQLRTVRTKRWKCTVELGSGAGEMYDLLEDPTEMNNRFDDPAFRAVRDEMEALIKARPGPVLEVLPEPIGMA